MVEKHFKLYLVSDSKAISSLSLHCVYVNGQLKGCSL